MFAGSPQQTSKSASSSSPLSFTPTAVMRKMTAEKDKIRTASQVCSVGGGGLSGSVVGYSLHLSFAGNNPLLLSETQVDIFNLLRIRYLNSKWPSKNVLFCNYQEKSDNSDSVATSPPSNSSNTTSSRLTGRTASQVQGAARVSSQLGMNEAVSIARSSRSRSVSTHLIICV